MESNLRNQLIAWASSHNLNMLVRFHNDVRGLIKGQFEKAKTLDSKEKALIESTLNSYDVIHRKNTFLMIYSYVEEWLYICGKHFKPEIRVVPGYGSIGRFKSILKKLGIDVETQIWQDLKDAEKIRNCLLHANGRVDLCKYQNEVKAIIEKKDSGLKIVNKRIELSGEYVQTFNKKVSEVVEIIINQEE